MNTNTRCPDRRALPPRRIPAPHARRGLACAVAMVAAVTAATPAFASTGSAEIVGRPDGRVLPVYEKDGRRYVVGTPGQEYAIRACNRTGARVLAVMSVDGVNVVSGETASTAQAGYVLDAWACADIGGWRKSLASIAAFHFTELPDAYATRTGRPANVGVVGVAYFRERVRAVTRREPPLRIGEDAGAAPTARRYTGAADAAAESSAAEAATARQEPAPTAAAPAPAAKIGTGHGRPESSYAQTTHFERSSPVPDTTIVIHYDRHENLVAMGVLPPPVIARPAHPFPAWTPRFVPDPPR